MKIRYKPIIRKVDEEKFLEAEVVDGETVVTVLKSFKTYEEAKRYDGLVEDGGDEYAKEAGEYIDLKVQEAIDAEAEAVKQEALDYLQSTDNTIIQEYEKDGQHVTKWAGGRMELSYSKSSSFVINIAEGAVFRNDYTAQVVDYVEAFTKILSKNINFTGGSALVLSIATVSDINIASDSVIAYASVSVNTSLSFAGLITGTWK